MLPADYDIEAHKKLAPMQPGDVPVTYADSTALECDFRFTPKIVLREGLGILPSGTRSTAKEGDYKLGADASLVLYATFKKTQ